MLLWNATGNQNPCKCAGVMCEGGEVTVLRLPGVALTVSDDVFGFNNFVRMRTLYLENNQLTGTIPELKLQKLEQFNVSFNMLKGSIPANLQKVSKITFAGNSLCGSPLESCPGSNDLTAISGLGGNKSKKKLSGGAIAGIVIGSVLGFPLILIVLIVLFRKKSRKNTRSVGVASLKQHEVEINGKKQDAERGISDFGNGTTKLLDEENEEDELFWNQDALKDANISPQPKLIP